MDGIPRHAEMVFVDPWGADPFDTRRKYARRDVRLPARLRLGDQEIVATTENICPGGAFFNVQVPESASDLVAVIDLPHGRGLHVRARVRWRREAPAGIGVEFATFLPDPSDEINRSA
ncbi:MAG TPA: PilZ domain-containing protein [Myxococcales bacterium]|nr:PilZ domain-containing protein [Myxococcales bacterium]